MSRFDTSDPKFNEKWGEENKRLFSAMAMAITLWSSLESTLANILAAILCAKEDLAEVALFSIPSLEGRLRVIDNLISFDLETEGVEEALALKCWQHIKARIDRKKSIRNQIVHGTVAPIARRNAKTEGITHTLRIRPALADKVKWRDIHAKPEKILDLGLSANDVEAHLTAISAINFHLSRLHGVLSLRGEDLPAWRAKCRELAAEMLDHK